MKASTKIMFEKYILRTKLYSIDLHELGLKGLGVDKGLLNEMVSFENLFFYWFFYIVWIPWMI